MALLRIRSARRRNETFGSHLSGYLAPQVVDANHGLRLRAMHVGICLLMYLYIYIAILRQRVNRFIQKNNESLSSTAMQDRSGTSLPCRLAKKCNFS